MKNKTHAARAAYFVEKKNIYVYSDTFGCQSVSYALLCDDIT